MFVIFYYYSPMDNANNMELYRHNPLVENITHLHYILITAAVIVIHLQNWRQSESIGSTINALWKLHQCYFKHYDSLEIFTIDNYILWKVVAILLEVISMIALDCLVSPQLNIQFVLGLSSVLASQISIMLIGMHFHLALIYIYRFVWIINYQLLELVGKPGNPEASKIHQLHCIYRCLLDLNLQLVAIYECLTVLFFSSIVSANISSVYYFLVYAHNLKEPVTGLMLTNIIHVVLINVLDFWLHITICERSVRASRGTSRILKLFVNVPSQDVALDRSVRFGNSVELPQITYSTLFPSRSTILPCFAVVDVLSSIAGEYFMWTMQWDFA